MGLDQVLLKTMQEINLQKGEDEETYKKFAQKGMDLMHPVSIKGKTHREDINIPYHATIKCFNTDKDKPEHAHEAASKLHLNPPNPKHVGIEPTTLKGQAGNTMHVIRLHGPHADEIKEHHKKLENFGHKDPFEFHPHITVDKKTWHDIKSSGAKTAHEAGIEFGHAQLRHGSKTIASYKPKENDMEKGALKHIGAALGIAGALATAQPAYGPIKEPPKYSSQKMLNAISQVESQGGKVENHKPMGGIHHGESAFGKYGLTPVIIRETIKMNPDLSRQHAKALNLHGNDLTHYMQDNPNLENVIAQKHLSRLEHHFGQNPEKIGYSWLNGVKGTYDAEKAKKDISNHWHVRKIKDAYSKEK